MNSVFAVGGFGFSIATVKSRLARFAGAAAAALMLAPGAGLAQVSPFAQAVAEAAVKDRAVAEFYQARKYKPLWVSKGDAGRRRALFSALSEAGNHGLPTGRYRSEELTQMLRDAKTNRALAQAEVAMSQTFLQYVSDIRSGILDPSRVVPDIKRKRLAFSRSAVLAAFAKSSPRGYIKKLPPNSSEYTRLMAEKLRLEKVLGKGGWGPKVSAKKLQPGDGGAAVVSLRNRLIAMGYMKRTASQSFDAGMQKAVQAFQRDHGLNPDGVAGPGTIAEINQPVEKRLQQIIVAMERERWLHDDRGDRHVLVNITDFHARIIDHGKVTFATRSVVGKNQHDRRTPEFSDVMEHMVINPTWNVPRSIATKEYLPMLKRNPNAVRHLRLVDARGRTVSRANVDFTQYTERSFPFNLKEPPSQGNALGLVKFMFPNQYNIYLHDTPAKSLFSRETRAYSHGCVRLNDPFDFAYELLARQVSNPQAFFKERLDTGRETTVVLKQPLPVHIIYRTALTQPKGRMQYRRDVYGRDATIFSALAKAGVALRAVRS